MWYLVADEGDEEDDREDDPEDGEARVRDHEGVGRGIERGVGGDGGSQEELQTQDAVDLQASGVRSGGVV